MLFLIYSKPTPVDLEILVFEVALVFGLEALNILNMLFFKTKFKLLHLGKLALIANNCLLHSFLFILDQD